MDRWHWEASPFGLASEGSYIWVANSTTANATKLRASDGASVRTFPVGNFPTSVAFDGANVWVTNETSNTVSKLKVSFRAT